TGARIPRPLRHRRGRPAGQPVGRRDRDRPSTRLIRRTPDDATRARVRRAPRGPLRSDRHVHRHRHGRHGPLGEPELGGREVTTPAFETEVVTKALLRLVPVPGLTRPAALVTLDNGFDHTKPNTLGPAGLASLDAAITEALAADPAFIAITGKPY